MNVNATNNKLQISPSKELTVLRKIVEITNSELELKGILSEVVIVVTEMAKADSVFIYLYDEKRKHLVLKASKTPHNKELDKVNLKAGEGITGWVAKENKPVAINKNAYKDKRFKNFDVLPEDRYEAFLSVPVIYKGRPIGVVNIQHKKIHEYSKEVVNLMSIIAKQIGGVIEHARLFEVVKQKAVQFDSLIKVSQSITSRDYLDEILNLIVVLTAEMLNSKICSIMMLDKKKEKLSVVATQSLSVDYKKKPSISVNNSISGQVVSLKKPLTVFDVQKESKYRYRELAQKENLTSMVVVPMIVKNEVIGVINVYMKNPHHFTDEEIDVLQMVANQAAVAIENTKLMEEAIKAKEALETRKLVERAKNVIMRMNNLSEQAAHKLIHKKSMDSCRSMKEIAESILLLEDIQK